MLLKREVDRLLITILRSQNSVSNLNLTSGKSSQVESNGVLTKVNYKPEIVSLKPFQCEMLALLKHGSADCVYDIPVGGLSGRT